MKLQTKAVHAGDRKKAGAHVPATTPIYTASSYFYESMEELDRVFGQEDPGYCYARYDNPTNAAPVSYTHLCWLAESQPRDDGWIP